MLIYKYVYVYFIFEQKRCVKLTTERDGLVSRLEESDEAIADKARQVVKLKLKHEEASLEAQGLRAQLEECAENLRAAEVGSRWWWQ